MLTAFYHNNVPGQSSTQDSGTIRSQLDSLFQGDNSVLKPQATSPQSLALYINPSTVENYYMPLRVGTSWINFAGDTSITATVDSTNPRINILVYDTSGTTLKWIDGTPASSPSAPDVTNSDYVPICQAYIPAGATMIVNYEDKDTFTSAGYIYKDIRPFLSRSGVFTEVSSVVQQDITEYDEDFVFGSPSLDDDGNSAHDSRMFFDKSGGSFRVGVVGSTQWDDTHRGDHSFASGYETEASGGSSHAEGSNTIASGADSHAEGVGTIASGNYGSHAEGSNTTASGDYSHAEGYFTVASGSLSHAEGGATFSTAMASHGEGVSIASGDYSHAEGYYSKAYLQTQHSQAGGRFVNIGDAQFSRVVLRADTTDATQETMYINNNSANKVILPASTTWGFKAYIVARSDGGDSSYWEILGAIKRDDSNNTALVGSITKNLIAQDSGASSWDVTAESDDTNEALAIKITGADSTNIRWTCSLELVETGY